MSVNLREMEEEAAKFLETMDSYLVSQVIKNIAVVAFKTGYMAGKKEEGMDLREMMYSNLIN